MSQKLVLNSLTKFGLKKAEAKVYFYLSKKGPKKAVEIRKALGMSKQQLYPILKSLKNKAIINATIDHPAFFSSVEFEEVLDILCNVKIEEAKNLQTRREKLLLDWKSINLQEKQETDDSKFIVIKGKKFVLSKINQMVQDSKSNFSAISNISSLFQIDQFGILDRIKKHPLKDKIDFRIITDIVNQNLNPIKELIKEITPELALKVRNPDIGLSLFPKMFIKDNEEILYFISSKEAERQNKNNEYLAIFSNSSSLIEPFSKVFEELWNNSTNIYQKIDDIESGKVTFNTTLISDPHVAMAKYTEILENVKQEIFLVVTSQSLIRLSKNKDQLKKWFDKGLKIKIMSPITRENIKAAKRLSEFCHIKHSPSTYVETTIVDKQHLFQFSDKINRVNKSAIETFRRTFYTNDSERVQKSLNMLQNIWDNSCNPSILSVNGLVNQPNRDELVFKFHPNIHNIKILNDKPSKGLTEKDVLNKIINVNPNEKKNPKHIICCSSMGFALIHSPTFLKLPDTLIGAFHIHKKSSLGGEDAIMVYFWQETSTGFKYVPVALFGDNPNGMIALNNQTRGTPAEINRHLVERDQINIQVHGNTLYAEWKMSIPIMQNKYTLPPAAFLLESYGKIRTQSYSTMYPNEVRNNWAINSFEAFVTFMHKDSKYTGPGTDGLLIRDAFIETIIP